MQAQGTCSLNHQGAAALRRRQHRISDRSSGIHVLANAILFLLLMTTCIISPFKYDSQPIPTHSVANTRTLRLVLVALALRNLYQISLA